MTGFVYFIRGGEFVKIGFSKEPKKRLVDLTTSSPFDLTIIATHPGTKQDESSLHWLLAPHHHRGEWFHWHQDVEQIALNGLPSFGETPQRRSERFRPGKFCPEHDGPLTTAGEVMDALGGNSAVRALTKSSPARVSNWRIYGTFPPNTYVALQNELERLGFSAPAHLWKMREAEAEA